MPKRPVYGSTDEVTKAARPRGLAVALHGRIALGARCQGAGARVARESRPRPVVMDRLEPVVEVVVQM
jgi:hypothetical protein